MAEKLRYVILGRTLCCTKYLTLIKTHMMLPEFLRQTESDLNVIQKTLVEKVSEIHQILFDNKGYREEDVLSFTSRLIFEIDSLYRNLPEHCALSIQITPKAYYRLLKSGIDTNVLHRHITDSGLSYSISIDNYNHVLESTTIGAKSPQDGFVTIIVPVYDGENKPKVGLLRRYEDHFADTGQIIQISEIINFELLGAEKV